MFPSRVCLLHRLLQSSSYRSCHRLIRPFLYQRHSSQLLISQTPFATNHTKLRSCHQTRLFKLFAQYSTNSSSTEKPESETTTTRDEELKDLLKEIHQDFSDKNREASTSDSDSDADTEKRSSNTRRQFDVDEELLRYDYEEFEEKEHYDFEPEEVVEEEHSISLERGSTGVFDIEEVVQVLQEDNAIDLCAIRVPPDVNYVDYMVIVTGRSTRHLNAMAEYMRKLFKRKRRRGDPPTVKIEGKHTDWLALDLGNIAVHLFTAELRETYDLESLWTVGAEFDTATQTQTGDELLTSFWGDSNLLDFSDSSPSASKQTEPQTYESVRNWHAKS